MLGLGFNAGDKASTLHLLKLLSKLLVLDNRELCGFTHGRRTVAAKGATAETWPGQTPKTSIIHHWEPWCEIHPNS